MTFNIFRIMWMLIHLLYSIANFLVFTWVTVRKKFEELLSKDTIGDELEYIARHVKLLVKVPSHLVVIIGNERIISFDDLANITVWCIAAGISFVSFYDHNGVLRKNQADLISSLSKIGRQHINKVVWGTSITNGYTKKNGTNGTTNGATNGYYSSKVTVNIFSLADGKGGIVDIAKSLSQSASRGDIKSSDITLELIDSMLHKKFGVPEPELALFCGGTCSTYGFLPWHIRVTEFMQLQSHHNIKVRDFLKYLNAYGDCEQRFGK